MKKQAFTRPHQGREAQGNVEAEDKSPSSKYSSKSNHISAKLHSSNKKKHMKDLDKVSTKFDQQILSSLRQPKTMSSLTSRNAAAKGPTRYTSDKLKNISHTDNSAICSANITHSIDSVEGASHISTKTDQNYVRKHSPINISSMIKEGSGLKFKSKIRSDLSSSRNKMLKNKTLPNLMNYTAKATALMKGSTRSITKKFMNPTRKYYNSK